MPELQQNFGTLRQYLPAVLRQNSMGWYIEYYAYNQISKGLERKRVRVNRERKRARTFAEFRSITTQMIIKINCLTEFLVDDVRVLANLSPEGTEWCFKFNL